MYERFETRPSMDPLRIAVLAHLHHPIRPPFAGGMEAHTSHVVADLCTRGHEVTLFAKAGSAHFGRNSRGRVQAVLPADYQVRGYPDEDHRDEQHRRLDGAMSSAISAVRAGAFDVVINNSLSPIPHDQLDGIPTLHLLHTPPLPRITAVLATRPERPHGHRYATVSHSNARAWRAWIPDLAVIPNGIDLRRWEPGRKDRIVPGTAAWTGRITPEKGTHLAIAAARANGLRLRLAGPIQDPEYYESLIRPSLDDKVRYMGHLGQDQLREVIASAQVFISSPLWEEPFGLTTLEAMACGTPVAATPNGAMAELIGASGGVVACTADEAGLANAIREAVGLRRADVLQRAAQFSRDQMIRSYEEALYDLHAAQSLGRVQ